MKSSGVAKLPGRDALTQSPPPDVDQRGLGHL